MKASIHGRVSQVPLSAALTVANGRGVTFSTILDKQQAAATPGKPNVFRFGTMFPQLAGQRLPDSPGMASNLADLARSMDEGNGAAVRDSTIPAVYTYLGQFIDHDITKTETLNADLASNMEAAFHAAEAGRDISPLDPDQMLQLVNKRVPTLNLDSVLASAAPRDAQGALIVGRVTAAPGIPRPNLPFQDPPGQQDDHDLPRNAPTSTNEELDRRAQIGDPRNDENLVVAQLHVAFLRAHRRLVHGLGMTQAAADLELQRLYQSIVVTDFLPKVCDPAVVAAVLRHGRGVFYHPSPADAFMPLEFSVAAYRFGHSMVRNAYDYNSVFPGNQGTLKLLFTFTAFSGDNFNFPTLPQNWIIDWSRWVPNAQGATSNVAKQVDTLIAGELMKLPQHQGVIAGSDVNVLALRNLIRGYLLRLPTGQAVATAMGTVLGNVVTPLTPQQIRDVASQADLAQVAAGRAGSQLAALLKGNFHEQTPLWYYVLAEAAHVRAQGGHLGPVASVIISDVLLQLLRMTEDNYLETPQWLPRIPTAAPAAERKVSIADLFRFAQVLP